jgi:hypothetical protein
VLVYQVQSYPTSFRVRQTVVPALCTHPGSAPEVTPEVNSATGIEARFTPMEGVWPETDLLIRLMVCGLGDGR